MLTLMQGMQEMQLELLDSREDDESDVRLDIFYSRYGGHFYSRSRVQEVTYQPGGLA